MIYAVGTTTAFAAKRASKAVPIVFYAGSDFAASGLVESFRKPGGRLTGIYSAFTDLTAKRLELLTGVLGLTISPLLLQRADAVIQ